MGNPTRHGAAASDALRTEHALVVAVVAVLVFLAVVPIGFLVWRTFVVDGSLTLDSFREAYSAVGLGEMALSSLLFMLGTTPLAVGVGTALAYLVLRTDLPGRRIVVALTVLQLPHPGRSLHDLVDLPREPAYRAC